MTHDLAIRVLAEQPMTTWLEPRTPPYLDVCVQVLTRPYALTKHCPHDDYLVSE